MSHSVPRALDWGQKDLIAGLTEATATTSRHMTRTVRKLLRPCCLLGLGLCNKLRVHRCVLMLSNWFLQGFEKGLADILAAVMAKVRLLMVCPLANIVSIKVLTRHLLGVLMLNI